MEKSDCGFEFVKSIQPESIEVLSDPETSSSLHFSEHPFPSENEDYLFNSGNVQSETGETNSAASESPTRKEKETQKAPLVKVSERKSSPKPAPRKSRKESPYAYCLDIDIDFSQSDTTMSRMNPDELYQNPWRKTVNWQNRDETLAELKDQIENYKPMQELLADEVTFPSVNILLFGGVGSGKSSVFNTLNSVFRGKIFNVARCGNSEHSLTTKFSKYPLMSESDKENNKLPKPMKFKICDMRGLESDHLMSKENMRYILEGHIADKFPFDPSGNISQDMPGFIRSPKLEDRIHCVALVQDATTIDAMQDLNPDVNKNIKEMQRVMNAYDIPQVVVLTKIDQICEDTERHISFTFRSPKVENCVSKVSEMLGLPRNAIFPMKNYEKEYQLDPDVDTMALLTLKGILTNCDAHLFNHYDIICKDYGM